MPRKRAAPTDNGTHAKKAKTTTQTSPDKETTPTAPSAAAAAAKVPQRWSPVSVSANIAKGHEERFAQPNEEFVFECYCPPRFERALDEWEDEEDDEDEDENEDENDENKNADQPKCDAAKTCLCHKKATDHPDHPWVLSVAGEQMYLSQFIMAHLRPRQLQHVHSVHLHSMV
ncbi:hypothetical protein CCM_03163 [Cordyceps militaris CM01]|uniref:Uncharacterized protein n=1 Tax=Cordyceps militaris (strain CM01) TaxID=983644 RepID=G3J963_CORMM|nr:uncharacterized protein CCM_03163 [Cordyceps militaris CM01]EGX94892.1 hypothetical protein CCM_03163 [Cordyceps militaris CM01]